MVAYRNCFGEGDNHFLDAFSQQKDRVLSPLLHLLAHMRIIPNMVSALSLLCAGGCAYFVRIHTGTAIVLLTAHVFFDGIDGALARHTGARLNAWIDCIVDQAGFMLILFAMIAAGKADPVIGAWYLVTYTILIALLVLLHIRGKPAQPIARTRLPFYALFILDTFSPLPLLEHAMALFAFYSSGAILILLPHLRCSK